MYSLKEGARLKGTMAVMDAGRFEGFNMASPNFHRQENGIPIFPLGVVWLPEWTMPLQIVDERYKISREIAGQIGEDGHLRSYLAEKDLEM